MNDDTLLPFDLPAVARKKVSVAFDGGWITSDGGVMLKSQRYELSPDVWFVEWEPYPGGDKYF